MRWYKDDKGYGRRITADDDEVLFVHFPASLAMVIGR
jgi:cold shock CspA family protein